MSADSILLKTRRTTHHSRKIKSEPLPDYFRLQSEEVDPPVIASGIYENIPVVAFGEIHGKISNQFYKNLKLDKIIIMVEHPSIMCDTSPLDKRLFFNVLKGSEWIWYKQAVRKKPVICIDNRMELGFPSKLEAQLASEVTIMSHDNIQLIAVLMMKFMIVFGKPEIKREFVENNMTPIFVNSMKVIKDQFAEYLKISQEEPLDADKKTQLFQLKNKLLYNFKKVAGILVDFNIIRHIKAEVAKANKDHIDNRKPIYIFCGAGHAYRLHNFFPDIFYNIEYNTTQKRALGDMDKIVKE